MIYEIILEYVPQYDAATFSAEGGVAVVRRRTNARAGSRTSTGDAPKPKAA